MPPMSLEGCMNQEQAQKKIRKKQNTVSALHFRVF